MMPQQAMADSTPQEKLLFVFSGQTASLDGLWRELRESSAVFKSALSRLCHEALDAHGICLFKSLDAIHDNDALLEIELAHQQPALFAVQVAISETWAAHGVLPDAVIGHSFGEFAAAVCAGIFTWQEGLAIVVARGKLMSKLPATGAMMAVSQSRLEVEARLKMEGINLVVACENGPDLTVVSGVSSEVEGFQQQLQAAHIACQRLETKHAFHSPHMLPMQEEFGRTVHTILANSTRKEGQHRAANSQHSKAHFISTVSATTERHETVRSSLYWMNHVTSAVEFNGAMRECRGKGYGTVVEIAPASSLVGLLRKGLAPQVLATFRRTSANAGKGACFESVLAQVLNSPWAQSRRSLLSSFPAPCLRSHSDGAFCKTAAVLSIAAHSNRDDLEMTTAVSEHEPDSSAELATKAEERGAVGRDRREPDTHHAEQSATNQQPGGGRLCRTILEAAERVVRARGPETCFRWLSATGAEEAKTSYSQLWARAGAVAELMLGELGVKKGDRVLLCFLPGVECMVAFWACLRASAVAVPVYPPNPSKMRRALMKLEFVRSNCGASLCLHDAAIARMRLLSRLTLKWPRMAYHCSEGVDAGPSRRPTKLLASLEPAGPEDLAYLQFTSGSTGDPKGVMVSHRNLWHNVSQVLMPYYTECYGRLGLNIEQDSMVACQWVPQYHDLGLVAQSLTSFVLGQTVVGMSPLSFLGNPLLWLQAMSRYRATSTCGPNFSYALVAKRLAALDSKQLRALDLDLSALRLVGNCAERVRPEVVERFECAIKPLGFRGSHFPCYGLAECVVAVSWCCDPGGRITTAAPPRSHLAAVARVRDLKVDVRVVDPESSKEVRGGVTGEIWVCCDSVAEGYWGNRELSDQTFGATLADDARGAARYLRTGDEGFCEGGFLYVCGRIKDIILLRGRNVYPEDVEEAVMAAAPGVVRPNCLAAFSWESADSEDFGVVFEVYDGHERELEAVISAVTAAVAAAVDVKPSRLVAIRAKTIPKTTSGKIQRRATKQAMLDGALSVVWDTAGSRGPRGPLGIAALPIGAVSAVVFDRALRMIRDLLMLWAWLVWPLRSTKDDRSTVEMEKLAPGEGSACEHISDIEQDPETASKDSRDAGCESEQGDWLMDLTKLDAEERKEAMAARLSEVVRQVAEVETVRKDDPWGEMGLDSMGMVCLATEIQKELGDAIHFGPTAMLDFPSLQDLVDHLDACIFVRPQRHLATDGRTHIMEPMAIVGMACRLPHGCNSPMLLWESLLSRTDCTSEIPLGRMDWRSWEGSQNTENRVSATNRGAFVDGIDVFDHSQYGISAAEAFAIDPEQRVALEVASQALAQAGTTLGSAKPCNGMAGVFVGQCTSDFAALWSKTSLGPFSATGAAASITANRISHTFGLRGPSMSIDTACSSSLVAVDAACKAMANGDCETAVVVGVNLMLSMDKFVAMSAAGMLSPHGRCAAFSDQADGYARGEGCGSLVLKPLSQAMRRGEGVWAVLHGAAVNQDGRTATLTAPNGPAQEQVIRAAIQRSGIDPDDIAYVEAHGTGTPLGDPLEAGALAELFGGRERSLVVGAVKSNVGHLEAAAGLAGLIKAVLCVHHRRVPPNIHCDSLNPLIEPLLMRCPLVFPEESVALDGNVFAGVSSFGFGGTNAHVVVGERPRDVAAPLPPVLPWSCSPVPRAWQRNDKAGSGDDSRNHGGDAEDCCGTSRRLSRTELLESLELVGIQVDETTMAMPLEEIGLDSLQVMQLSHCLRSHGVQIHPADLLSLPLKDLFLEADGSCMDASSGDVRATFHEGGMRPVDVLELDAQAADEWFERDGLPCSMFVDHWLECAPSLDFTVERLTVPDVLDLHDKLQRRREQQQPLCVVVYSEELAAYVRSIALQHQQWQLTIVISDADPGACPTLGGRNEFRFRRGQWAMKRLQLLYVDPLESELTVTMLDRTCSAQPDAGPLARTVIHGPRRVQETVVDVREAVRMPLLPTCVEVRVHASALHSGTASCILQNQAKLVFDFAGVVTNVGSSVRGFACGDAVFGVGCDSLGTYAVVDERQVALMTAAMPYEHAAALPTAMIGVHQILDLWARVEPGQGVVVTDASDGTALAVLQHAVRRGCRVLAGVWSRAHQKELQLRGVDGVVLTADAGSWSAGLRQLPTIDVVVHCRNDRGASEAIEMLRPGGRCVNVRGKTTCAGARTDVAFHSWSPADLVRDLDVLAHLFASARALHPAPPAVNRMQHDLEKAVVACAQGHTITPLVVSQRPVVDTQATVLITGGLGHLGRLVAQALIEQGAGRVVLVSSRTSELPPDWALHVRPEVVKCDVGDLDQLRAVMVQLADVRGIIHAAGAPQHAGEEWEQVYRAKVLGARNLEACVAELQLDLDFFILFSSVAALGSPSQEIYAAANGCLDTIAQRRFAAGQPCLSLRWGPWVGGGMLGDSVLRYAVSNGIIPLTERRGVGLFLQLLRFSDAPVVVVCSVDKERMQQLSLHPASIISCFRSYFSALALEGDGQPA